MNTKTMRLPPRRLMTAGASGSGSGSANKRKERDDGIERPCPKSSTTITTATTAKFLKPDKPSIGLEPISASKGSNSSNQLLAGYLAHEFLTKGTLFGQPWDPTGADGPNVIEKRKRKPSGSEEGEAVGTPSRKAEQAPNDKYERYVEVAGLLKGDGAHLFDVVNPTQLARFFQL